MVNINLTTEQANPASKVSLKKQLSVMILLFLLLGGAYAGFTLYEMKVRADIDSINGEYAAQNKKLSEGNNLEIVDFQNRINAAKAMISKKDRSVETLKKMEALVVSGAYISSYLFEDNKNSLSLIMIGDNYNTVAKQILSFKKSNYFSEVSTDKSETVEKGSVKFNVSLKLNNN